MEQVNGNLHSGIISADICGKWHQHGKGKYEQGDPHKCRIDGADKVKLAVVGKPERGEHKKYD